jgi:hypothetical protein
MTPCSPLPKPAVVVSPGSARVPAPLSADASGMLLPLPIPAVPSMCGCSMPGAGIKLLSPTPLEPHLAGMSSEPQALAKVPPPRPGVVAVDEVDAETLLG